MNDKKNLFEKEPVLKAIINLALPSIIGQIILVIYNMADTYFVGLTKSDEMITAVTICMPAFMFISAISSLFGIGGASGIARALGKRDFNRAKHISTFAIWGCIVVTLLYCFLVYLFKDLFINAIGGTNLDVHKNAIDYLLCAVVAGGIATSMNTLMAHLFRAYGYSFYSSIGITLGGVLNIILDPIFMFVILPKGNEAFGAALATAISNSCALIYFIVMYIINKQKVLISFKIKKEIVRDNIPSEVFRIGIAACLMTLCENVSYAILDKLIASAGTAALAGIGVAKKVNMLAHCIVRGMTQGVLPLIAYNYSSRNIKRMRSVVYTSTGTSIGIALLCTFVCTIFSRFLIGIFIKTNGRSLLLGTKYLQILCIGAPFSAFAYSVISFFQAIGKGNKSLFLALMRKGALDIPLMFILGAIIPITGVVWATPATDLICSALALILFNGDRNSYYSF